MHPRAWQRPPLPLAWGTRGVGEHDGNGAARLPPGNVPARVDAASGAAAMVPPPQAAAAPLTQLGFLLVPPQSSRQVPAASCLITKAKTIALWLLCSELSPKTQGWQPGWGTTCPLGFSPCYRGFWGARVWGDLVVTAKAGACGVQDESHNLRRVRQGQGRLVHGIASLPTPSTGEGTAQGTGGAQLARTAWAVGDNPLPSAGPSQHISQPVGPRSATSRGAQHPLAHPVPEDWWPGAPRAGTLHAGDGRKPSGFVTSSCGRARAVNQLL